jgi:diguanylate cyclase (GGDEF)-like protein
MTGSTFFDAMPVGEAPVLQQYLVGLLAGLPHIAAAWIAIPDAEGELHVKASAGTDWQFANRLIAAGDGLNPVAQAWQDGCQHIADYPATSMTDPALALSWGAAAAAQGWRTSISLPLPGRNGPKAVLTLCADQPGYFTAAPAPDLLAQLAALLGLGLAERADHAAMQRIQHLYQALFMGSEALLSARSEQAALRAICRRLVQSQLFIAAAIGQPDQQGVFRYSLASAGDGAKPVLNMAQPADEEGSELLLGLRAWRSQSVAVSNDYAGDSSFTRWRHLFEVKPWQSAAAIPIHRNGALWAVLLVAADQRDVFDKALVDLVERLGMLIGRALAEMDRKAKLQQGRESQSRLARQDSLTGLPNRMALLEQLPRILARARRTGGRVAIGILDLDDFKPVNDSWGHAAGDALLRAFSQRLQGAVRETDLVVRLGGDEFVVILDSIDSPSDLPAALTRLHNATTAPYLLPNGKQAHINLSLGLTLYPEDQSEPEILLRHADEALYASKAHKIRRRQFWMLWSAIPDAAESNAARDEGPLAVPLYGGEAAAALNRARDTLLQATDAFIGEFYAKQAKERQSEDNQARHQGIAVLLERLSISEAHRLRAEQKAYLQRMISADLTAHAHQSQARRAGQLHALAGLSNTIVVAALQAYSEMLLRHVRSLPLWRADRIRLSTLISQRLSAELAQQIEGANDLTLARQQFLIRLNAEMLSFTNWPDFMRKVVAQLVLQEGIVAVAITRLGYQGNFIHEYTAGAFDAYMQALEQRQVPPLSADAGSIGGQSPQPRAWRSESLETNPSYVSDPAMGMWQEAAHAAGIRSSAALPLKDPEGRMFATLALYGDIPGLFETPQTRMFIESVGTLISQGQHQLSPRQLAAPIPAAQRREFRERLYDRHLEMHYQPIVDLRSGLPAKAEALARLRLRDGSLANPQQFLAGFGQAELTRLFLDGLDQALAQLQVWNAQGLSLSISLNLPPSVLVEPQCHAWVQAALRRAGVAPSRLYLEILESEELLEAAKHDAAVAALGAIGVPLVMDDLGAGYSSLLRLRKLPFHTVKIDQALVSETHQDPQRVISFMGSLVRLAQSLDLHVVVEGLETAGLIEAAGILGADAGQGYGIARPMAAAELLGWVQHFTARHSSLYRSGLCPDGAPHTELGELAALWCQDHRLTQARYGSRPGQQKTSRQSITASARMKQFN